MSARESAPIGFIGLGNMGGPIAANIAAAGFPMIVFDKAGTAERAPEGAGIASSAAEVAARAEAVLLSLPDGAIVEAVAEEICQSNDRKVRALIDTSTVGVGPARALSARLAEAEIAYYDAPVSGGTAGAKAGTVSCMFAGPDEAFAELKPVFEALSSNVFHVGREPGQGQAMKLLNNFLSATAMVATSEAVAFGVRQGLDMQLICDVVNVSSGQNTATTDKFPRRIVPGLYDAGFTNTLMSKDVRLFLEGVREDDLAERVSERVAAIWRDFEADAPGVDFTRVYPWTAGED